MATPPPAMAEALARLWVKFLPEMERRVAVLEAAALELAGSSLPQESREAAHAAAHKLAGSLGTFGLREGTTIARQAESLLAAEASQSHAAELASYAKGLRAVLDSRK